MKPVRSVTRPRRRRCVSGISGRSCGYLAGICVLVACDSDALPVADVFMNTPDAYMDAEALVDTPEDSTQDAAEVPLVHWRPCPELTGGEDDASMCATLARPVRSGSAGGTIDVFVKRYPSLVGTGERQMWLLAGGPGGSGVDLEPDALALRAAMPTLEVFVIDHRGTGRSERLGCPVEERLDSPSGSAIGDDEWASCIAAVSEQWGDGLEGFSTTEAARDLRRWVEVARRPDVPVYMFGRSYGTYLLQRYLQLEPDALAGAVLDSSVPPGETFASYDVNRNRVAESLFEQCANSDECASHFEERPWSALRGLYADIASGHCASLGAPDAVRDTLRQMTGILMDGGVERRLIPAIAARAIRCEPEDVTALAHLFNVLNDTSREPTPRSVHTSRVLAMHIALSELWPDPGPTYDESRALADATFVSSDLAPRRARLAPQWPRYTLDDYHGLYASTSTPLMILQGTLDAATPRFWAEEMGEHYAGHNQHLVLVRDAPHAVLLRSPITGTMEHCGIGLVRSFVESSDGTYDSSCLAEVEPLRFREFNALASWAFGTSSIWNN